MRPEHLTDEELVDAAEGRASRSASGHTEGCSVCRNQVEETIALLRTVSDAVVPEPSPLYWETLRHNVRRRIERERALSRWALAGGGLVAAAALAIALFRASTPAPGELQPAQAALPSWSALPVAEEDAGLRVIEAMVAEAGDQASDLACRNWRECVASLSDDEALRLRDEVRAELRGET